MGVFAAKRREPDAIFSMNYFKTVPGQVVDRRCMDDIPPIRTENFLFEFSIGLGPMLESHYVSSRASAKSWSSPKS